MRQPKKCLHPKFVDRRKPSRTKTIISCFTRPPGQASNLVVYNKQWFMNLYKPITGPKTDKILFWFKTKMNTFRMEIASHGGNPTQRNVIVIFIGSLLIIKLKLKAFIMNFQKTISFMLKGVGSSQWFGWSRIWCTIIPQLKQHPEAPLYIRVNPNPVKCVLFLAPVIFQLFEAMLWLRTTRLFE